MTRSVLILAALMLASPALALDFPDDDNDGYTSDVDCDDANPNAYPGAAEVCDDNIDQDCDGVDEPCPDPDEGEDNDGDGVFTPDDCDDSDPSVYPGAPEVCDDWIDQDCDGIDVICPDPDYDQDGDGHETPEDCNDADSSVFPGAEETCDDGIDQDCDGVDEPCPDPLDTGDTGDTAQTFPEDDGGGAGCVGSGTGSMYASLFLPLLLLRRRRS